MVSNLNSKEVVQGLLAFTWGVLFIFFIYYYYFFSDWYFIWHQRKEQSLKERVCKKCFICARPISKARDMAVQQVF